MTFIFVKIVSDFGSFCSLLSLKKAVFVSLFFTTAVYSLDDQISCARAFSKAVYNHCKEDCVDVSTNVVCRTGDATSFEIRRFVGERGLYGALYVGSAAVFISFRGSVTLEDWVRNFCFNHTREIDITAVVEDGTALHSGFYLDFLSCRDSLISLLPRGETIPPVCFTGHSAGGALAVIASYFLHDFFSESSLKVVTFSAPQVGNKIFSERFNKKLGLENVVMFQNECDLVPRLLRDAPVEDVKRMGYSDVGVPIIIKTRYFVRYVDSILKFGDSDFSFVKDCALKIKKGFRGKFREKMERQLTFMEMTGCADGIAMCKEVIEREEKMAAVSFFTTIIRGVVSETVERDEVFKLILQTHSVPDLDIISISSLFKADVEVSPAPIDPVVEGVINDISSYIEHLTKAILNFSNKGK